MIDSEYTELNLYKECKKNIKLYKENPKKYKAIYIVDDSKFFHVTLSGMLRNSNYLIVGGELSVNAGYDGYLKILACGIRPVCLIDVQMIENGINLIEKLKDFDSHLWFIMITEIESLEIRKKVELLGAKELITKQKFNIELLEKVLKEHEIDNS